MNSVSRLIAFLFLIQLNFAFTQEKKSDTTKPDIVEYYFGSTEMLLPNGKSTLPPGQVLLKRTVSEKNKTITEALYLAQAPGNRSKEPNSMIFTQRQDTNMFNITDNKKTIQGVAEFTGEKWKWNSWRYEVNFEKEKSKLKAKGEISNNQFQITRDIIKDGKVAGQLKDKLQKITELKFNEKKSQFGYSLF